MVAMEVVLVDAVVVEVVESGSDEVGHCRGSGGAVDGIEKEL